jgi:peptidoglycan hydrolase-like protein with peptidoglycan-binding domain
MIRLKQILEGKESVPNILFISDNIQHRRIGFARELISRRICTGDIYTEDRGTIYDLRELANAYVSSYYDLVVVVSRGLYETENSGLDDIITDYEKIITQCHQYDIPIVLSTLPTNKFIDDKFIKQINIPKFNILAANGWIKRNADYILDTDQLLDDTYFDITGINFDREAHKVLYSQMLVIIKNIDPTLDIESEEEQIEDLRDSKILLKPGDSNRHVATVQAKLIQLGYKINQHELSNRKFGKSTTAALIAFKMKHGLNANDVIDRQTLIALQKDEPDVPTITSDDEKRSKYAKIKPPKSVQEFFNLIAEPAKDQETKYGIPASITMAQAALESGWGKSELAYKYNNYFGVKCVGSNNCIELIASDGKPAKWRVYDNMLDSFDDHSKVLKGSRYSKAFTYPISDYENWAIAIQDGRYAGISTTYADTLIKLIEQYGLDEYVSDSDDGILSNITGKAKGAISSLLGIGLGAITVGNQAIFKSGTGRLQGAMSGGMDGDWAGSLPKLISILPPGTWKAGSQKRSKVLSVSGGWSDHNLGKTFAYGADFGLNSTFNGDKVAATEFAIAVARNAGKNITSWEPYIGSVLNYNTSDGYRVQIIWQSNVGGNHYDHVHVGVLSIDGKNQYKG